MLYSLGLGFRCLVASPFHDGLHGLSLDLVSDVAPTHLSSLLLFLGLVCEGACIGSLGSEYVIV